MNLFRIPPLATPKTKECINIGDVISYVPCTMVQGHNPFHRKAATVIAVTPSEENTDQVNYDEDSIDNDILLEVSSGDMMYGWMVVQRKHIFTHGKRVKHPGIHRSLESFSLKSQRQNAGKSLQISIDSTNNIFSKVLSHAKRNTPSPINRLIDNNVSLRKRKATNTPGGPTQENYDLSGKATSTPKTWAKKKQPGNHKHVRNRLKLKKKPVNRKYSKQKKKSTDKASTNCKLKTKSSKHKKQ